MGRTEKSQGLAPPAVRKDIRAKQARQIINKSVPAILASNARARRGAEGSELIVDPKPVVSDGKVTSKDSFEGGEDATYVKRKGQGRRKVKNATDDEVVVREGSGGAKGKGKGRKRNDSLDEGLANLSVTAAPPVSPKKERRIRIMITDTITAAHMLTFPSQYNDTDSHQTKSSKKQPNTCILNMASPLRPGGGVLSGATSQEEFLCARTTLLPSLNENFYRLPELGGIYTTDVLVFRSALPLGDSKGELGPGERYFVDVVSAGMLRFPELEGEEDEVKRLNKKDREMVEAKMRAVLRIVSRKGSRKLVLGAWGCGAYGNPVADIARAWKKVLDGGAVSITSGKKGKASEVETWPEIEEVIFAINNRKMAHDFAQAFGGGIEVESGPGSTSDTSDDDDEQDKVAEELRTKIQEMESQLSNVWNPDLKARMGVILDGLKAQLRERAGNAEDGNEDEEDGAEGEDASENEGSEAETGSDADLQSESGEDGVGDDDEYVMVTKG